VPEAVGVSARKPGTHWVAEQEPLGVAVVGADSALAAEPRVADAAQAVAADEEDNKRITNNEQMNDEG